MPINFIPNDPLTLADMPIRSKPALPERPARKAGFTFVDAVPQNQFNPGTAEFLFWQCREAALMALEMWELLNGPLSEWARSMPNRKRLRLIQNNGVDLNAYYDGASLSFFEFTTGAKTTFSGASTDVVAHEAGHAFLDAIRPDLWDSNMTEPNAFHEAFGDCIAILTALFDQDTRTALLNVTADLGDANFVEATAEDLSDAVRLQLGPNHSAAAPRRALNDFLWQLPTTLPASGPPSVLISEIHSFGRVFSGCFYDVIRNIFAKLPTKNEASLLSAAQTAGRLLIEGAKTAPESPRFFQAVGRAMSLADQDLNGGANRVEIRDAFASHNINLGSSAMLSARASLAGLAPKVGKGATGMLLSARTRSDLKRRISADSKSRLTVNEAEIAGEPVAVAINHREISLTGLNESLKGVVAIAAEPVVIGGVGGKAAIMSSLPEPNTTADEVHSFVETLLKNGQIDFKEPKKEAGPRRGAILTSKRSSLTHTVHSRRGKMVLVRVRFACRCGLK